MSDLGSYIWFIGLGGCLVALGIAMAFGRLRGRPSRAAGNPNNAWEQAAKESGHPEVARPEVNER
jgi:hypothetical protein